MKLHELSIKRPVAVMMIVLIFVVLGAYSLTMLPLEMMPDMELSMAIAVTQYNNVGSAEVENLVTRTVEGAISSVSGISSITSQTSEGTSIVMAEFNTGTDMDLAVADMKDKLSMIEDYLPEDAEKPMVMKMDMNAMPIAMMNVSFEGYDLIQTKKYIEDEVKSKLEAVNGVASVNVYGASQRQLEVIVDQEKLFGYGVSLSDVVSAVAAQNQNLPSGTVEGMGKTMSIRTMGKLEQVKEIESVPLITPAGQVLYLRDIAAVKDRYAEDSSYARLNGDNSLTVSITKQSDANTVEVVNALLDTLQTIKDANPKFSYAVTMEQASYIEDAVSSVAQNAVTGAVLAVLVLLLFLGSVRSSLIIGISIPVSVVTTFIGMYFSGMSLNIVSLGGLALGVGMLVDNSVVVLENIFVRRKIYQEDGRTAGVKGAGEVVAPVIASVLTTCIVYVPILFIDNIMAVMFKQLAFSIIFSQVASLLVTFMLVPMLSAKVTDIDKPNEKLSFILKPFAAFLNRFYGMYERTLRKVLRNRKKALLLSVAVFLLSLIVLGQLGMTLIPSTDEGIVNITVTMPQGTKLDQTDAMSRKVEDIISRNEYVRSVSASVGSNTMSSMTGSTVSNTSSITVGLTDKSKRRASTNDVAEQLRQALSDIVGAEIEVSASSSMMSGMSGDQIEIQYSAADDKALEQFILRAQEVLASVDGVTETANSLGETKPEVRIYINDVKAAQYGLNTQTTSMLVHQAISGMTASRFTENGKEYDIIVMYPEDYVSDYNALKTLRLNTPTGRTVTLSDIADIKVEQGYATLMRVNQKRTVSISGVLYNRDMQSVKKDYEKAIAAVGVPDGISQSDSGTYRIMIDAMLSLLGAILLGILLMYMVMAAQFESFSQPLIILFSVPLSIIGVVLALAVTGSPLSVIGCIGILMLVGIVVNNAIVLIDYINASRKEQPEADRTELVVEGGLARMRPVLMTTITSVLGFFPMAVSGASGAEMMQPLAVVLIGGLCVGTILTLYVIPVLYTVFDDKLKKRMQQKKEL